MTVASLHCLATPSAGPQQGNDSCRKLLADAATTASAGSSKTFSTAVGSQSAYPFRHSWYRRAHSRWHAASFAASPDSQLRSQSLASSWQYSRELRDDLAVAADAP